MLTRIILYKKRVSFQPVAEVVEVPTKGKKGKEEKGKKKEKTQEEIEAELEAERLAELAAIEAEKEVARRMLWKPYEIYVDKLISETVIESIVWSLKLIVDETDFDKHRDISPLFELILELHDPNIVYIPSVELDDADGFVQLIKTLVQDIQVMSTKMDRIDRDSAEANYYEDVLGDKESEDLHDELVNRVASAMDVAQDYTVNFEDYAYLWMDDRQEFLRQFLLYSRLLTPEELDALKDETGPGIKECRPTTPQFREQIDFYEELYKKVEEIEMEKVIAGWLRIDVKRLRQAILNTVCKWGNMFKQHLFDHVISGLDELETFIVDAIAGMQVELKEDDYEGLLKVMGYLFKIRDRQLATDVMFDPLKEIMELLKEYGVEFSEEVHIQLQELPDKWIQCKKVIYVTISIFYLVGNELYCHYEYNGWGGWGTKSTGAKKKWGPQL